MVSVDVAGRDGLDTQMVGEIAQEAEPTGVPALVRPLQLDVVALATEDVRELRRRIRVEQAETSPRAAGQADESLVQLGDRRKRNRGRERLAILVTGAPLEILKY
jgi:hypothetical protein